MSIAQRGATVEASRRCRASGGCLSERRVAQLPAKPPRSAVLARPRCGVLWWVLALCLPLVADAWTREAPSISIQYRIVPDTAHEVMKPLSGAGTDHPVYNRSIVCKNVTNTLCTKAKNVTSIVNATNSSNATKVTVTKEVCLESANFTKEVCSNFTNHTRPAKPFRSLPNFYVSNVDEYENNASVTRWTSIGCFQHAAKIEIEKLPGVFRANISSHCRNLTDENETMSWWDCTEDLIPDLIPDDDNNPFTGMAWTPLNCTTACSLRGGPDGSFSIAAMNGMDCFCLRNRTTLKQVEQRWCATPCMYEYYNGTAKFCGGPSNQYSLYQMYDNVHQTGQGCLDPFRKIWYMGVVIEQWIYSIDTDYGNKSVGYTWYLHGSSSVTGEPMFPFHVELEQPLYGLQYDLDNSSILGYTLPFWPDWPREPREELDDSGNIEVNYRGKPWNAVLERYEMDSGDPSKIFWYKKDVIGPVMPSTQTKSEVALFLNGLSALDSINDIYYITVPQVEFPYKQYNKYSTKIYGFDIDKRGKRVLDKATEFDIVDIQCDSRDHMLYGLMVVPAQDAYSQNGVIFFRLGYSFMTVIWPTNPFDPILTSVEFFWKFKNKNMSDIVVNDGLFWNHQQNISEKFFQVGNGAIDPDTNKTFVLYKDSPDTASPFLVKDVNYKNKTQSIDPRASFPAPDYSGTDGKWPSYPEPEEMIKGGVAAAWLANPDPIYPWFRPRLEWLRFVLDGDVVIAKLENFTQGGVQPFDINGDTLPDEVDWSANQLGLINCSDVYGPNVSQFLGDMPPGPGQNGTTCEWYYNDTIYMYFTEVETLFLGDPVDLKNLTIFGYFAALESWTFSAYGIHPTQLPDPLYPPVVEVYSLINGIASVDFTFMTEDEAPMCSTIGADAENSYWHGGTPYYSWFLKGVACEYYDSYGFTGSFNPNSTLLIRFVEQLMDRSYGSKWTYKTRGYKRIEYTKHGMIEPGCAYDLELYLYGRWGLASKLPFKFKKRGPPGVVGFIPSCDYHCNEATCEPPSQCLAGVQPGPLVGPMVPGERVCVCDENRYGLFCDGICPMCSPYRTFGCDDGRMGSGVCICKIGWDGKYCDQKLEYWATTWSPCLPCGAAVGSQFRVMKCTNIVTTKTVNNTRCPGLAPLTTQNCKPPLCPCGPPPEIPGADNATIAANCPETLSGGVCKPICQDGFIVVGEFRCYAGAFIEMPECIKSGLPVLTVPGIQINMRMNDIETDLSADEYLVEIGDALKLTFIDLLGPVEVPNPDDDIKLRIRDIPPSGNRTIFRRLEENGEAAKDSNVTSSPRTSNSSSIWRRWEEVHFGRNSTNSSDNEASAKRKSVYDWAEANFSGHRAAASDVLGMPDLRVDGDSLDRASASIANRIMSRLDSKSSKAKPDRRLAQHPLLGRRLALANFEIGATISLKDSTALKAATALLGPLKDNPGAIATSFSKNYQKVCNKPCQGLPQSFEASAPSETQVYILATGTAGAKRLNTTTTTRPPPPPVPPPPPPDHSKFTLGITIGVSIGICLIVFPMVGVGIWIWRLRQRRLAASRAAPEPPAPRAWEARWELPESAKIRGSDGTPLSGHTRREWQGGGTYEGQVKDGMREGDGRMEWPNGKSFAGKWLDGRPHGHGLLHAPGDRGWTYNGQFKEGQRHGVGRCESLARRIWFDGEWSGGLQNGMGENGSVPSLPGDSPSQLLPPPVAHIWEMQQGEQHEHVAISKVAPESSILICLALDASAEDLERIDDLAYLPGGDKGPPHSHLQIVSRLWGVCFGQPDYWLPSCWGALVLTRIMEGGALARWNMWQRRDFGDKANIIQPNALIWRVNGVEGNIPQMSLELSAERDRRSNRLQLAISNPPHTRLPKKTGIQSMLPLPATLWPQSLRGNRPPMVAGNAPPQPPKGTKHGRQQGNEAPPGMPALGDLRQTADGLQAPPIPPSAASRGRVPQGLPPLPGLPSLPDVPHGATRNVNVANLPSLPDVQQHLSTLALPPPPPNVPRPPPGRPGGPQTPPSYGSVSFAVGPPPKSYNSGALAVGPPPKAGSPPRIGYRRVAATRRGELDHPSSPQVPDPPG